LSGAGARRSVGPLSAITLAFALATSLTVVAHGALPQGALETPWIWVTALVLLGLPHGAVDPLLRPLPSASSPLRFHVVYLALLTGAALFWWSLPSIALTAFLLMSVWHFAHDWPRRVPAGPAAPPSLLGYAGASCVVVLPCVYHPEWVVDAFTLLARSAIAAEGLRQVLGASLPLLVVALLWGTRSALRDRAWADLTEVAVLVVALAVLPPVLSFTLYFCCVHSPRHLAEVSRRVPSLSRLGLTAALFTTLTAFAAGAFVWFNRGVGLEPALTSVVFIGLSVLTVPHLWTVARWQCGLRSSSDELQPGGRPAERDPFAGL
jgi:beta-carotene 15,15'-dioxygenase